MDTSTVVRTRDLTKVFGSGDARVTALNNVSVDIAAGRFIAIMGPSGSGKSTLMHCAAGLERPTAGEAWLGDTALSSLSDDDLTTLRRDRVGFVFQSFNLLPMLTARENITLPFDLAGRRADDAQVSDVAAAVSIADRLHHRPAQLSGGQQQRVACARAFITAPDVIFADEPTGALDSASSAELLRLLRHSVDELGRTVIMVTHEPGAAAYADQVLLLADGRVSETLDEPTLNRILRHVNPAGAR